jgi:3-methyladenine DNA glycosylase/8-oxoguanine DNA glycosylase
LKLFLSGFYLESVQLPDEQKMFRLAKPYEGHWTALSLYLWKVADNAKSKK